MFEIRLVYKTLGTPKRRGSSPGLSSIKGAPYLPYARRDEKPEKGKEMQKLAAAKKRADLKKRVENKRFDDAIKKDQDRIAKKHRPKGKESNGPQKSKESKERVGLEPYVKEMGKAFERLSKNPKALYEFIRDHRSYMSKDGSEGYKKWNKDLFTAFKLPRVNDQLAIESEYGLYAGALQIYLSKNYFKKKLNIDVFDSTKGNRANPFMRIDDKIGAYTMSVLVAYWNREHAKDYQYNGKRVGKFGYATLDQAFGARRKNQSIYDSAINRLKKKLGEKGHVVTGTPLVFSIGSGKEGKKEGAAKVASSSESDLADKGKKNRQKDIEQRLMSKKEIQDRKDNEWNEAKKRIQSVGKYKKRAELLKTLVFGSAAASTKKVFETEFSKLRDEASGDPNEISYWSKYETTARIHHSNWSFSLFKSYKEAFNKAKANPTKDNLKRKNELYKMLSQSAADFYTETEKVIQILKRKYQPKLAMLAGFYDLPSGTNVKNLSLKNTRYEHYGGMGGQYSKKTFDNPAYVKQRKRVKPAKLRKNKEIDSFFTDHFKARPKKVYATWEAMVKDLGSEAKIKEYFIGLDERGIIDRVNQIIYLRNMHSVYWESKYYSDQFQKELGQARKVMLKSAEAYYTQYKGKKNKDFAKDILSGRL